MIMKIFSIILYLIIFLPIQAESIEGGATTPIKGGATMGVVPRPPIKEPVCGIITEIIIKNNHTIGRDEILDMMGIRIGDSLDYDVITRGIKSAFLKGSFSDIRVSVAPVDSPPEGGGATTPIKGGATTPIKGGATMGVVPRPPIKEPVDGLRPVLLLIEVVEREFIDSISIEGNVLLNKNIIRELFEIKENMVYYENAVVLATDKLINQIEKLGFPDIQATTEIIRNKGSNKVMIKLIIKENDPYIIKRILIQPASMPTEKPLIDKKLKIYVGDIYNEKEIKDKIQSLITYFKEKGYFRFQATYEYNKETGQLILKIDKGESLNIVFTGNNHISDSDLTKELLFFEIESINPQVIMESIDKLIKYYHKNGYPNVSIEYNISNEEGALIHSESARMHISFNINEGVLYKISSIKIKGSSMAFKTKILDALTLKEGEPFNIDYIESDKTNLIEFLQASGFLDIVIQSFDVNYIDDRKKVAVTISIKEGQCQRIESINIEGNIEVSSDELLSLIALKTGSIYNNDVAMIARHVISSIYVRSGFSDVIVKHSLIKGKVGVQLNFIITEGNKYIFGNTIVKGNQMTSYKVFKTVFTHKRGDPYDYNLLLAETLILNRTGLFKSVTINIIEREDNIKDIVFEVEESNRWILESGFGYAEYEGARGFIDLGFRNIFGGNRQVRIRAQASEISQMYAINYIEPWFLPPISLKSLLSYTKKHNQNVDTGKTLFSMSKYTATIGIERPLNNLLRTTFFYELSHVETYNVQPDIILSREDTGTLLISSIVPSILYDSRDNPFDPHIGILSGMSLKIASKFLLSETDFVKITGYFNDYVSILDYLTLAFSIRSGAAYGIREIDGLPIVERFFLGGLNTIRGFKRDEVGPKSSKGSPTGGNFFCLSNIETRIDIGSGFGAIVFFDIGNVLLDIIDIDIEQFRKSAGLGVRYMTPVGPFRLDYGYKLDRRPFETMGEFHFSLGHTF